MRGQVGQRLTVEGTARNGKAGAVVMVEGEPLYLEGLAAWPAGLEGGSVRVTGTLREQKLIGDRINDAGELVQGEPGLQLVIEGPSWERPRG